MNFKDLQFSIGKLTTGAYSHLAKKNPLQKQDTRALSSWIFEERNSLYIMRMLAYHRSETNRAFEQWIKDEIQEKPSDNKDLEDIGDKLLKLMMKQNEIEEAYAGKYQQYRRAIKAIREREERLSDIREKKRALQGRIGTLNRSNSKSPKLRDFTKELESLERDTHDTEMEMSDFKRFALREAFYLRFNAMHEMAEKLQIIAGFGKYIVDLLDIEPTPHGQPNRKPYDKGPEAAQILADALMALDAWRPAEGQERPTLADQLGDDASTTMGDDDDDKGKGRAGGLATAGSSTSLLGNTKPAPPPLPRRPQQSEKEAEAAAEAAAANPLAHTTGDVKTDDETQTSLDDLDLYGPPPAYTATDDGQHSPRNSYEPVQLADPPVQPLDAPVVQHTPPPPQPAAAVLPTAPPMEMRTSQDKVLDESEEEEQRRQDTLQATPQHPAHQRLLSTTPSQQSIYTQSPQPMHQEQVLQQQHQQQYQQHQQQQQQQHQQQYQQHHQPASPWVHPGSTWSQSTQPGDVYHTNYSQLYRQISRNQRHAPPQIPYSQFQQQYQQQRVDAGGFRIPPPSTSSSSHQRYPTADEEKQALAERYGTN